jgi:hypothetical protein
MHQYTLQEIQCRLYMLFSVTVSSGLWSSCFPEFNMCNFYLLLCILYMKCPGRTHYGLIMSAHLSAYFSSRTTGGIRIKFGMGVCHWGLPPNRTAESCEVGSTGGTVWWPKLEPCSKLEQWLELYHGYHGKNVNSVTVCTVVSMVSQ